MRVTGGAVVRTVFPVLAFVTLLAGDLWRYSIGWWGFAVIAATLCVTACALLARHRRDWAVAGVPIPLAAFLALATGSILWSYYPSATAVGTATTWATTLVALAVAVCFSWQQILSALGVALRGILALSLLFEVIVAVFVRRPVLPWVGQPGIDYDSYDEVPKLLMWSRNELFEVFDGGRIQGIVGSSATLGLLALLALIVFCVQLASSTTSRARTAVWIAVAAVVLAFTRPATVIIALVAVVLVVAAVLFVRRVRPFVGYPVIAVSAVVALGAALLWRAPIFAALGKSDDLTGRTQIWTDVAALAAERPVAGWGWVSYWAPWVAPFDTLAANNGVRQLHAHNAWLDVWLQLGAIGVVIFAALIVSTVIRTWSFAVDRHGVTPHSAGRHRIVSLLPLAILVVLLVQSITESRLLVEYGWALLVIIAVKTRADEGTVVAR